jgi:hypothetical protein
MNHRGGREIVQPTVTFLDLGKEGLVHSISKPRKRLVRIRAIRRVLHILQRRNLRPFAGESEPLVVVRQPYWDRLRALSSNPSRRRVWPCSSEVFRPNDNQPSVSRAVSRPSTGDESLEAFERDKDKLLESYATLAPEALDALDPEERRAVYFMLGLCVEALPDKSLRVRGAFGEENPVWEKERTSTR